MVSYLDMEFAQIVIKRDCGFLGLILAKLSAIALNAAMKYQPKINIQKFLAMTQEVVQKREVKIIEQYPRPISCRIEA